MSTWLLVIVDRHGRRVDVAFPDTARAHAAAYEWNRRRTGRSITPVPIEDARGNPLGMIAGRDIKAVTVVETP